MPEDETAGECICIEKMGFGPLLGFPSLFSV